MSLENFLRDIELFQKANKKPSLMYVILRIRWAWYSRDITIEINT